MSKTLWPAVAAAAIAALLLANPQLWAQPPADPPRVARLVRDLGADSFAVRTQASEELAKLGTAARREIELATRSDDPEVRLRAKDLLRAIKIYDLWSAGRFTCPDKPLPATQLLRMVAEQTGNHVLVGDQFGTFQDSPVQFDFAAADYWPTIDEVCRQTGNHCRAHYDSRMPGVVVVAGAPGRQPLAYAGPVRGRITSARRAFNEELSYEDARSEKTHTFQLNLEMTWEDRFKLVAYRSQLEVLEACTDAGQVLTAAQPASGGWNVAGSGTRQLTMNLRLNPPPASARELDTLRLAWELMAVGDFVPLEVTDLSSHAPHFQDDVELIVDSFQPTTGSRYELAVSIRRDLNLPEPQEVLFQEHELDLLDATGQPLRKLGQTGTLADHGALLKATFVAEGENVTPKKLRFTYPRLRSQRELEVIFRHVPLPTGRPE
ncbi:MAG TPA: hypothetical protein VGG64_01335 [Pirellulales bacterium]|jgi:hypothetical protein